MPKSAPATAPKAPPLRRRGNRLYTAVWVILGIGAATYLTLLASGQNLPEGVLPFQWDANDSQPTATVALRQGSENDGAAKPASGRAGGNWSRMANDIANLQAQMSTVTSDVAQIRTVQNETDARLTTLEKRKTVAQAAPQKAVTVAQAKSDDSAIEGTTLDGVTHTSEAQSQPEQKPLQDNDNMVLAALLGQQDASANETVPSKPTTTPAQQTASLTAPEPATAIPASVPIPGRRTFGVELATGDSVDSLRLSWALLNERHRDLIGRLAPRYVHSGTGTQNPFRLIAGPFKSSRSAKDLCQRLQAYYVSCNPSAFTGKVL